VSKEYHSQDVKWD